MWRVLLRWAIADVRGRCGRVRSRLVAPPSDSVGSDFTCLRGCARTGTLQHRHAVEVRVERHVNRTPPTDGRSQFRSMNRLETFALQGEAPESISATSAPRIELRPEIPHRMTSVARAETSS